MRWRFLILGLAVGLVGAPAAAWAIEFELKTSPGIRSYGHVVNDDGKKLTVEFRLADGKVNKTVYERSKIIIISEVKWDRLQRLVPDQPKVYRDYAVELARLTKDPDALETALRLFLMAAYLEPAQFGRSCLLDMSALAGTTPEARKNYLAMAYLLDPQGNPKDLKDLKAEAVKPVPATGQELKDAAIALKDFQQALRSYRVGQLPHAKDFANRKGVDKFFRAAPGMMEQQTFLKACHDAKCPTCKGQDPVACQTCDGTGVNPVFPEDQLRNVLRAELWALEQLSSGAANANKGGGETAWSSLLQAQQVSPVRTLSLRTITKFDPRQCVFHKGAWVAP